MSFKSTRLITGDIFNLASGRFTHDFLGSVSDIGKTINKGDDNSSEEDYEEVIIYQDDHQNYKTEFNLKEAAEQREIEEFRLTELKEKEKRFQRKCFRKKNYIEGLF